MKDFWMDNNAKHDFSDPLYLQWLDQTWRVEITESARHLWPGQYTIGGRYDHEKKLYDKYEKEWERRKGEASKKKYGDTWPTDDALSLQKLAEGDLLNFSEDYFHWNVETPGWSLHRTGVWSKMLINMDDWKGKTRDQYPGIYLSYEEACAHLGKGHALPPMYEDYEKHLADFVEKYDYDMMA